MSENKYVNNKWINAIISALIAFLTAITTTSCL